MVVTVGVELVGGGWLILLVVQNETGGTFLYLLMEHVISSFKNLSYLVARIYALNPFLFNDYKRFRHIGKGNTASA